MEAVTRATRLSVELFGGDHLGVRAFNGLTGEGLETVGDVLEFCGSDGAIPIWRIANIGRCSVGRILPVLEAVEAAERALECEAHGAALVPLSLVERVDGYRARRGLTISDAIRELLEAGLRAAG